MNSKPGLLFLSQTLPYPPDGGVKIRTYHTLRNLAKAFEIRALCFYRWKPGRHEPEVEAAIAELGAFADVRAFSIPQEHSRTRLLIDHARSVLSGRVYTVHSYTSQLFAGALREELNKGHVDIVHLDSLDLSGYLPIVEEKPTVCVHHDAQSLLLRRRADYQANPLLSKYFRHQARLMEKEERSICPSVDINVTVSETDRQVLERIAPSGRFEVVPNGVDIEFFQPREAHEEGIAFVGGTSWYPNRDALSYYRSTILPAIRARKPDVTTTWVGRATAEEIHENSAIGEGLQLTGYVEDVRPYIAAAACYVVPLRIGGGTRIKILDAWAMGKAVVSTSIGCEGLEARDGTNILIADTPSEFAECVARVLEDPVLRGRLGHEARQTVEDRYSWDAIGEEMNQMYLDVVRSDESRQPTNRVSGASDRISAKR